MNKLSNAMARDLLQREFAMTVDEAGRNQFHGRVALEAIGTKFSSDASKFSRHIGELQSKVSFSRAFLFSNDSGYVLLDSKPPLAINTSLSREDKAKIIKDYLVSDKVVDCAPFGFMLECAST